MKKKGGIRVLLALKTGIDAISIPGGAVRGLKRMFRSVRFDVAAFDPQYIDYLDQAEILYAYTITPGILAAAPHLKWFHSIVTGPDTYAFPALAAGKVRVTSPRGVYAVPVAETALGLMLALARPIHEPIVAKSRGKWTAAGIYAGPRRYPELFESTVLIIGLGGIGLELAKRCKCMGMRVIGVVAKAKKKTAACDITIPFKGMPSALCKADFVVLASPLTPSTSGMIGKPELARMKRTAFLINIARGGLVDEKALVRALKNKTIAGAAFDAFATEPLPEGHPFFTAPNLIVTPHVSGWSLKFWERSIARFAENLRRYMKGKPLIGEVDFKRGY